MSSFVGYIVDENENPVQCYHQAYHVETGNWSDVRQTGIDGYYSRDHEDTDWDGNGVPMPSGDRVIVCFWENGPTRSGLKNRFSLHLITADGSPVYNTDVQVIPKTAPTCTWSVQSTGTINNNINSSQSSSDVYQWVWDGKTFKHDDYYFGQTIFDSVGGLTHVYDWDDGSGYVSSNSNSYSNIGDYSVKHKTINQYGLESICTKDIRLKYNQPSGYFTYSDNTPNLGDTLTVYNNITDNDTTITELRHYFDGILKDTNTVLNYSYQHYLDVVKDYSVQTQVYWNDGWEQQSFNINDTVEISNIAPTVDISINNSDNVYTFVSGADDFEDRLQQVQFKIYISPEYIFEETPQSVTWSLLDTHNVYSEDWNSTATFYKGGQFKITVQAWDQDGGVSTIDEQEFSVTISGGSGIDLPGGNQFFDWE
jgi:hypothetical protein